MCQNYFIFIFFKNCTMRIFLDEADLILRQLRKLYHTLPLDLRTEKSLIPASDLIVEAIEYITYLKEDADSKKPQSDEKNNNKLMTNVEPIIIKHSPIEPTLQTITSSTANPFTKPNGVTPLSPLKPKIITTQSQLLARTPVQPDGKNVPVKLNLGPRSLPQKVILRPTLPLQVSVLSFLLQLQS